MPIHSESLLGDSIYDDVMRRTIADIGRDEWESFQPDTQERIRQRVIEEERDKLAEIYRRFLS